MNETNKGKKRIRFGEVVYRCRDRVKQELGADYERITEPYRTEIRSRMAAGKTVADAAHEVVFPVLAHRPGSPERERAAYVWAAAIEVEEMLSLRAEL